LLFVIHFPLFLGKFFLLFYGIGIISMVYLEGISWNNFIDDITGFIEKFSIMGDNHISSFPVVDEVFFQPFHASEIDKVGRFIEQEKIRSRKKHFCESDFGSLSSTHFPYGKFQKIENPDSSGNPFQSILHFVSSENLKSVKFLSIPTDSIHIFWMFFHKFLCFCEGFLCFTNFSESKSEIVSYFPIFGIKMNL